MQTSNTPQPRRNFLSMCVSGIAALGIGSLMAPVKATAAILPKGNPPEEAESWFAAMKGKHKFLIDMPKHSDGLGLGWALGFMDTQNDLGVPDSDLSVILVFRYSSTPLAFRDPLWEKYCIGERIKLDDPLSKAPALRNPFITCVDEDDDCIELFLKRGGKIAVCNHAVEGMARSLAEQQKKDPEMMVKEFKDSVIDGIQLVPSGIWAVNRAQELGFSFCYGS